MKSFLSNLLSLLVLSAAQAQWSPNFSVNGKGINDVTNSAWNCQNTDPTVCATYDVSGMNWYLTGVAGDPFNFQFQTSGSPPQHDYAKVVNGQFWVQDPDGDICVTSPVLNISGLGTITASYSVLRIDCTDGNYDSVDDHVYSSYSINGGAFVNSATFTSGCGTTSMWNQTFSGNTAVVRLCMDANQVTEEYAVTNMSVNMGTVLPVKWSGFFLSSTDEGHCKLSWQTSSEVNNDFFEVERSMDGIYFTTLGQVKGFGNRSEPTNYHFIDESTKGGNTYFYRIKQVDFDGTHDFSIILSVVMKVTGISISASPNPVKDLIIIQLENVVNEDIELHIFSPFGQRVKTFYYHPEQLSSEIDISDLSPGLYYISSNFHEIKPAKFIKTAN
ncbi:MAG: T9SS type A sorting domain-containing protein [Saprospiraceae bacterium]|nr:T9SS type A sorting domain-containing protein [Saprospiraceae bacterium]